MKGLTKRQAEVVQYIQHFIETNNYSPSYREVQSHFNFASLGSVYQYIKTLKKKGVIESANFSARSLIPIEQVKVKSIELELPFIGYLTAGEPIETFAHSQILGVPQYLVRDPSRTYLLRAKGSDLSEELIAEGDLLIIEARQEAFDGETVAAKINNNEILVKQYYKEGEYAKLTSKSPDIRPIILKHELIEIQGVLVGVLRIL